MLAKKNIKDSSVLYIEDDHITRKQLSQFLKSQCKVLYTAIDGQEGLELYRKFKPEIVITDIEMPKMNGLVMAKEIRKNSLSTQIIIITAYKKPEYLLEAVNLQLIQYLIKPISLEKITHALDFSALFLDKKNIETKKILSDELYYDIYTKELVSKNKIINLSKYERALLELLMKKCPEPISYESINTQIYDSNASKNAIKLLVNSLRNKVKKQSIINVSGFGYKLNFMDNK